MESDKVKNIKKALECCTNNKGCGVCPRLSKDYPNHLDDCRFVLLVDILTLINELESENERLEQKINAIHFTYETYNEKYIAQLKDLKKENQQLKDLIAKLEKDRAELKCSLSKKTMEYELLKCGKAIGKGIVEVATKTKEKLELLEFAERLKKKLEESNCINNGLWLVDTQVLIDETLKEFINKGESEK